MTVTSLFTLLFDVCIFVLCIISNLFYLEYLLGVFAVSYPDLDLRPRFSAASISGKVTTHILHKAEVRWYRLSLSVVRRTELEQVMYVSVQHISKGPKMH